MARRRLPPLSAEDRALWDALKAEVTPIHAEPVVTLSPKTLAAKTKTPKAPSSSNLTKPSMPTRSQNAPLIWQAPGAFAKTMRATATIAAATKITRAAAPRDLRDTQAKGLDRSSAERLRRGKMPIEGRLDLHGMTQVQAQGRLNSFITQAARAGKRHLLVITGKGLSKGGASHSDHRDELWNEQRGEQGNGHASGRRNREGVLRRMVPEWLGAGELAGFVLAFSYAQKRDGEHGALYVLLRRR